MGCFKKNQSEGREVKQTAVDEVARVEVDEAVEDLLGDGAEDVHGDGPVDEEVLERARVHVLEQDARRAVDKERAVERDDILAVPRRVEREQLAHHAARLLRAVRAHALLVVAALRRHERHRLHRHQPPRRHVLRQVHNPARALPEHAQHAEVLVPQPLPRVQHRLARRRRHRHPGVGHRLCLVSLLSFSICLCCSCCCCCCCYCWVCTCRVRALGGSSVARALAHNAAARDLKAALAVHAVRAHLRPRLPRHALEHERRRSLHPVDRHRPSLSLTLSRSRPSRVASVSPKRRKIKCTRRKKKGAEPQWKHSGNRHERG